MSFPGVTPGYSDPREQGNAINRALAGKLNATLGVTLAANAAFTTVTDPRLSKSSFIGFCPLTATAAAELGVGTLYVSSQGKGTLTLAHADNAQTDRNFRILVIG